jgi:hypothetical protein
MSSSREPSRRYGHAGRPPLGRWDAGFGVLALGSGLLLLYLGRSLTFWEDEWRSITFDGGLLDYLRPVNQHWSTFPLLLYRGTFEVVGLRSYVPYLAEVILLHLVAVAGAYALVRKRLGPLVATLVAIPLLLLGSGAENLYWAFQTGFVGSVMFGVWALFFIERPTRRAPAIASALFLGSLASSGMGVFFLVVAAGRTFLDASLRKRVLAVALPFAIYLIWFALVGRDQVGDDRVFVEPSIARFAVRGIAYSTERLLGLDHLTYGELWGLTFFVGVSLVTALRMARGRTHALAAGCLLGVAAMYTVIGVGRVRADPGYDHATSSRYVYVAAFLLVLAVVDLLPERSSWSVRGNWIGTAAAAALLFILGCAIVANIEALRTARTQFQATSNFTRAFVEVALTRGHEPWVDRDAARGWMPSIAELEHTVAQHGSPVRDELFPSVAKPPDAATKEAALLALVGDGFRVEETRSAGLRLGQVDVVRMSGLVSRVGRCAQATLVPGTAVWALGLPPRARIRVSSRAELGARVFLSHEGGPGRRIFADFDPGIPRDVVIPDIGDGRLWDLALDSPVSPTVVRMCVLLPRGDRSLRRPTIAIRPWT